ncbi:MAG TPA: class I SAM-dependent methyltransferase [Candidatus Sulfotelmatobacter sp.]|nr:class I SAM-dependent methyltransferase [Candidatus Sulfotelmatobacter sp.]
MTTPGIPERAPTGKWSVWKYNWLANHKLIDALEKRRALARGELLDIGCGSRPFAPALAGGIRRYWGTDLPGSPHAKRAGPDACARAEAQPIRSESIDTVVSFSVVTYLREPSEMFREAYRVLRPGGIAMVEFAQMEPVLDAPHDYFRFTQFGARYLFEKAGFEVMEIVPLGGLWARTGLSLIGALNRINRGALRWLTEIPVRLLYVLIQSFFELMDQLFFDPLEAMSHLVIARKPERMS